MNSAKLNPQPIADGPKSNELTLGRLKILELNRFFDLTPIQRFSNTATYGVVAQVLDLVSQGYSDDDILGQMSVLGQDKLWIDPLGMTLTVNDKHEGEWRIICHCSCHDTMRWWSAQFLGYLSSDCIGRDFYIWKLSDDSQHGSDESDEFYQIRPFMLPRLWRFAEQFNTGQVQVFGRPNNPLKERVLIEPGSLKTGVIEEPLAGAIRIPNGKIFDAHIRIAHELMPNQADLPNRIQLSTRAIDEASAAPLRQIVAGSINPIPDPLSGKEERQKSVREIADHLGITPAYREKERTKAIQDEWAARYPNRTAPGRTLIYEALRGTHHISSRKGGR